MAQRALGLRIHSRLNGGAAYQVGTYQGHQRHRPGDTALTNDPVVPPHVLTPRGPRVSRSLPMQAGCTPLHAPSAWQVLRGDPTRTKGGRHWKETSDL